MIKWTLTLQMLEVLYNHGAMLARDIAANISPDLRSKEVFPRLKRYILNGLVKVQRIRPKLLLYWLNEKHPTMKVLKILFQEAKQKDNAKDLKSFVKQLVAKYGLSGDEEVVLRWLLQEAESEKTDKVRLNNLFERLRLQGYEFKTGMQAILQILNKVRAKTRAIYINGVDIIIYKSLRPPGG